MITQGTRQRELTFSATTHEIELDCSKLVEVNRPGYGKRTLQVVGDQGEHKSCYAAKRTQEDFESSPMLGKAGFA